MAASKNRAKTSAGKAAKTTFFIEGMDCASCVIPVKKSLTALKGVKDVNVNYVTQKAVVEYDPASATEDAMIAAVKKVGYSAQKL